MRVAGNTGPCSGHSTGRASHTCRVCTTGKSMDFLLGSGFSSSLATTLGAGAKRWVQMGAGAKHGCRWMQ